jgi:hypothetical protein
MNTPQISSLASGRRHAPDVHGQAAPLPLLVLRVPFITCRTRQQRGRQIAG